MYTELRYDDRQIPIKLIHFIAVFLGISYVHAGLNPLTEVPDTHAKLSGLAGQLRSQSHLMSLSLWLCYVLGQTNDTCCRCRFSLCFVPTVGNVRRAFRSKTLLHVGTWCARWKLQHCPVEFRPSNLAPASLVHAWQTLPSRQLWRATPFLRCCRLNSGPCTESWIVWDERKDENFAFLSL